MRWARLGAWLPFSGVRHSREGRVSSWNSAASYEQVPTQDSRALSAAIGVSKRRRGCSATRQLPHAGHDQGVDHDRTGTTTSVLTDRVAPRAGQREPPAHGGGPGSHAVRGHRRSPPDRPSTVPEPGRPRNDMSSARVGRPAGVDVVGTWRWKSLNPLSPRIDRHRGNRRPGRARSPTGVRKAAHQAAAPSQRDAPRFGAVAFDSRAVLECAFGLAGRSGMRGQAHIVGRRSAIPPTSRGDEPQRTAPPRVNRTFRTQGDTA